ncbi:retinol-binding protein pinta-like isoform X2 [Atheta coriaria]|uniref:retinol-binding protein pinta-like isoform X2 n=1 Tax=Dalotia coriaria TaxID=877792 RepID=UPI0031F43962
MTTLTHFGENSDMKQKSEDIEQLLQLIKAWLMKQPHLPQNIEDQLLRRFIISAFHSVEKTKALIDLNYTLRSQAPEIFDNRDPDLHEIQNVFNLVDFCPLPKLTEKKHKLFIYRLADSDPDRFAYADVLKAFFMVADYRMSFDREMSDGEVPIFDMNNTTLRHITKVTLPLVKKYMVYTQEAHPVRLRQIHVLNTTPLLDKCMAIVRPFLKSEVAKLLIFHAPNSSTLFDYISPELIPKEYGGTLNVTMESIKEEWRLKVQRHRSFYLDDTRWRLDENRRPSENCNAGGGGGNLFGMQGSFRSLSID